MSNPVVKITAWICLLGLSILSMPVHAASQIKAARIWPAQDYTRLTLESKQEIKNHMFELKEPLRVVIDLEDVELGDTLNNLTKLIGNDDPYIKGVRVANNKPGTVRLVLDLRGDAKPQLFELKPVGDYGYRLVLDVYPNAPTDPFVEMMKEPVKPNTPNIQVKPNITTTANTPAITTAASAVTPTVKPAEDKLKIAQKIETKIESKPTTKTETKSETKPDAKHEAKPEAKPEVKPEAKPEVKVVDKSESYKPENKAEKESKSDNKETAKNESKSEVKTESKQEGKHHANAPEARGRTLIIAIDAGHGGEDPGAHGGNGTHEKNVTLAIAKKVKQLVDNTPNMRGMLVRDGDYFIPLVGRVSKARAARADLFVSIHADAFIKPEARGSSVFALSEHGATSAAARWLAKKENEADLIGGVNIAVKDPHLARTLLDLSQTATNNDSLKLAKYVLKELGEINTLHRGEVEQAGFAVLKAPDIPSILVETAFISNPTEEARLNDENYQYKLADAIVSGIKRYFAQNPTFSKQKVVQR